jgi:hypothetical protein
MTTTKGYLNNPKQGANNFNLFNLQYHAQQPFPSGTQNNSDRHNMK